MSNGGTIKTISDLYNLFVQHTFDVLLGEVKTCQNCPKPFVSQGLFLYKTIGNEAIKTEQPECIDIDAMQLNNKGLKLMTEILTSADKPENAFRSSLANSRLPITSWYLFTAASWSGSREPPLSTTFR